MIKGLIYGLCLVGIYFLCGWLWHFFKALKDPDVNAAADLRMTISEYRLYQKLYDEYQEYMRIHGASSYDSEEFFRLQIFPRIKNPNKWRRYQKFRLENSMKQWNSYFKQPYNEWNSNENKTF